MDLNLPTSVFGKLAFEAYEDLRMLNLQSTLSAVAGFSVKNIPPFASFYCPVSNTLSPNKVTIIHQPNFLPALPIPTAFFVAVQVFYTLGFMFAMSSFVGLIAVDLCSVTNREALAMRSMALAEFLAGEVNCFRSDISIAINDHLLFACQDFVAPLQ